MSAERELDRWLAQATRGLPNESRGWVIDELRAHYQDALRDQTGRGVSFAEAHRQALADLGSAGAVGGDLRDTHLAERRCRVAGAASLIFPLTVLAHLALTARGTPGIGTLVYDLLLLLPLLYALRMLHTLFVLRLNLHVGRRLCLVALGIAGMTIPEIVMDGYWLALSRGIVGAPSALGLHILDTLLLIDWLGTVALGVGLIWLAEALLPIKRRDLPLLRPLALVSLIGGGTLGFIGVASVVGWHSPLETAWLSAAVLGVALHIVWMLLFFRAAQPQRPAFID